MGKFQKLKVYESGGLITFATEAGDVIQSEPKGTVRIRRYNVTGFTFENLITNVGIGYVDAYNDVLDESGATYGGDFNAVLAALGAFFSPSSGGGGGVTGAENGLYVAADKVRLGTNPLIEDTLINEDDFDFTQLRESVVNAEIVTVEHTAKLSDPLDLGIGLIRAFRLESATGLSSVGVWSDNIYPQEAYLSSLGGDFLSRIRVNPERFLLQALDGGVDIGSIQGGGNELVFTAPSRVTIDTEVLTLSTDKVEQQITGKYIYGQSATNGSFRTGVENGVFVVQKRVAGVWVTQNISAPAIAREEITYCDTFIEAAITPNWVASTGTGGSLDISQIGETGVVGISRLVVTTALTARYGLLAKIGSLIRTYGDGNTMLYKTKVRPESLGGVGNSFVINTGFLNSVAVTNPTVGLYFSFDRNNTARTVANPQNWTLVSRVNNVDKVVVDSGTAVQIGVWTKLAIEIDTATNTANFYINTVLVGSIVWNGLTGINSNIPFVGASTECSFGALLTNTGASLGTALRMDYIDFYKDFT